MVRPDEATGAAFETDEKQPHQRCVRQIEAAPAVLLEESLQVRLLIGLRKTAPVEPLDDGLCAVADDLHRLVQLLPYE